jgi:hypothetical protein
VATGSDLWARSFRYNRFLSQRVSGAISALAGAVKSVTRGKALYLFALSNSRLAGSGHLDLAAVLACPNLWRRGSLRGG